MMIKGLTILLFVNLCIFSTISINYEELTKDVFDKINLLRTNPSEFAKLIDQTKYPKFYDKVMESSATAPALKLNEGLSLACAHRGQKMLSTKKWDFSKPNDIAKFATGVSDPTFFTIAYNWKSTDGVHAISESSNRMTRAISQLRSPNFKTIGVYCGCYCPTLRLCPIYLSASDNVKSVDGAKVAYLKESTTGWRCYKTAQMTPGSSDDSSTDNQSEDTSNKDSTENKSDSSSTSKLPLSCLPKNPQNYQQLVKDSFVAQNHLRQNPKEWAAYMTWLKGYFDENKRLQTPSMTYKLTTNEGTVPVVESQELLSKMDPLPAFTWDDTLARAAQKHVLDVSYSPVVMGHSSRNGESFGNRVKAFFVTYNSLGENIAYGPSSGIDQIAGLFIDDGVASRGHRMSIISKGFTHVGIACGCYDNQYRLICVYNFGSGLTSKTPETKYNAIENKIESSCTWNKSSNPFEVPQAVGACASTDNKDEDNKDDENKDDENKNDENKDDENKDDENKDDENKDDENNDDENKDEEKTSSIYQKMSEQVQKAINELRTEKGKEEGHTTEELMGLQQIKGWNLLAAQFHSQLQNTLRINTAKFPRNLFRYSHGFAEPFAADIIYSNQKDIKESDIAKIVSDNIKQSEDLKSNIFNGDFTSFGTYCSCHKYASLFCVVFFSSGQDVWTNKNDCSVCPKYPDHQGAPALNCGSVTQQIPKKNATPFNELDFIPHSAETFVDLIDEINLNMSHLRLKPDMWRGYLSDYYSKFVTDNTGYFPMPDGEVLKVDLSRGNGEHINSVVKALERFRTQKSKITISPGLSHYAKDFLTLSRRDLIQKCGKGQKGLITCYVQSARIYTFEISNVSNGQNTVARLLTDSMRRYLPMRVIRWTKVDKMGVACGCDGKGGNKCVFILGFSVQELSNPPTIKSSSGSIGETCDTKAAESEVNFRELSQFLMDE